MVGFEDSSGAATGHVLGLAASVVPASRLVGTFGGDGVGYLAAGTATGAAVTLWAAAMAWRAG